MYCATCGAQNADDARSCLNCGAARAGTCQRCNAESPPGARFCPSCGKPAEARPESTDTAHTERRQVTVLFADLAGFTSFVHRSDVEDVREVMSSLWNRLDAIIADHGGITEKHIGDAIMAVFGAKQAREDDPVQAVRAALEMQAALREFPASGAAPLQMRLGVHTGLVVVGPLGASGEFAATGDAVNLANRLEQNAPIGGVLISHDTYRLVFGNFNVKPVEPFAVKGRPDAIRAYLVTGAKPRGLAAQLRGVEGVATEMIGREAELKVLQEALRSVLQHRQRQMVTIVGEGGIGKSCLLREFQNWVELLPTSIRWFGGRATAEMTRVPFSLMRDVFSARFEIQDSDLSALARQKFEEGFLKLLAGDPTNAASELRSHAQFVGQLLGMNFSERPGLRGIINDAEQIRHRAFQSLSRFFTVVSGGQPGSEVEAALLIAEDIHWGDQGSLDLIEHLARTCEQTPLLIVCLARPALYERRSAWGQGLVRHARLNLEPLSRAESLRLVETILRKSPEVPQALRELIVGGAEGVPFFIEEIINMLIDQRVIVPGTEHWRIEPGRLAAASVPPTLTGVLQARLDRLIPAERAVLRRASVVGRTFWDSAVEALSVKRSTRPSSSAGGLRVEIQDALDALRRKELISRRPVSAFAGTAEYAFKHELLRSVAYEGLLKKSRRDHHARVAAWLIDHSGERIQEFAALVARHFEHAERLSEAAEWYGRAGQQARQGYAPATAIDCYRKALALDPAADGRVPAKQVVWNEGLGEVLAAQARFAEALEAYSKLLALAERAGDSLAQAKAWNGLAFVHERLGKNRPSIDCAEKAALLAKASGLEARADLIRALHLKGWACYRLGDAKTVLALGDHTSRLCTEFQDQRGLATSLKLHGVAHLQLGHYREADRFFEQGLTLCEELDDRRNTAAMFSNRGECARMRGQYAMAARLYEQALDLARQIGHRESEVIYLSNLSAARLGLRQFKRVEADLRQAIELTGNPNSCALAETYTLLSEACLGQNKLEEAFAIAEQALSLARESENDLYLGNAWRVLGQVLTEFAASTAQRAKADPAKCFAESLQVFQKINAEGEQARTLLAWSKLEHREGRSGEARAKADAARAIFVRLAALPEAVEPG